MYIFIGKPGHLYKFNSNCPANEKSGTGPGSCGGSKTSESLSHEVTTRSRKDNSGIVDGNISVRDKNGKKIGSLSYTHFSKDVFAERYDGNGKKILDESGVPKKFKSHKAGETRLDEIEVDEEYRRKGIGSSLVNKIPPEHSEYFSTFAQTKEGYHHAKAIGVNYIAVAPSLEKELGYKTIPPWEHFEKEESLKPQSRRGR